MADLMPQDGCRFKCLWESDLGGTRGVAGGFRCKANLSPPALLNVELLQHQLEKLRPANRRFGRISKGRLRFIVRFRDHE